LASVSHGNAFRKSEYWGGRFQRCDFGDHLNSKHGPGQLTPPTDLGRPNPDVAEAINRAHPGDLPLQARLAWMCTIQTFHVNRVVEVVKFILKIGLALQLLVTVYVKGTCLVEVVQTLTEFGLAL